MASQSKDVGRRIGWYLGFIAGFCFLPLAGIYCIAQHQTAWGISLIALYILHVALVLCLAPWRLPNVSEGKILIPIACVDLLGIATMIASPMLPNDNYSMLLIIGLGFGTATWTTWKA